MAIDQKKILRQVPDHVFINLAKKVPGHSLPKLLQDPDARIEEFLRVCDKSVVEKVIAEYPGPSNFTAWLFTSNNETSEVKFESALKSHVTSNLLNGIKLQGAEDPKVFRVDILGSFTMFRCAALDREANVPAGFLEIESVPLFSYYDVVLHFSQLEAIVFGPFSGYRAAKSLNEVDNLLGINSDWQLLKPGIGKSRELYSALKAKISGNLAETKRDDPAGDYRAVTFEARDKFPDIEQVPGFKKSYFAADSLFDVLEFSCKNSLNLTERVRVKFGRPHGRFTFGPNPSLSAIRYFQSKVRELLRPT